MKPQRDLTSGRIVGALLTLAVPIVLANLLQTAYQLTDTYWVGRLGAEAVAAVSLSFPIIFLMISLGGGLAIAGTILVAQYYGKGDRQAVNHVAAQTVLMMCAVSVVLTIVGYLLSAPLMKLMGAEPEVLPDAVAYLQISFLGLPFLFGYFVYQSLMRGVGDVKTPMFIVLGTVLLNFVLDPLLIRGYGVMPGFGVSGAAIATIATQGLAAATGMALLFSGRYGIHVKAGQWWLDLPLIGRMFALGLPACVEQSTRALGMTIMTLLVASFGTVVVASYGIGVRILSFVIIPALGMSMATSTIVGQNMGAGKIDRAQRSAVVAATLTFAVLLAVGVLMHFAARPLAAFFIPGDEAVIAESARFIKIIALTFGCIGLQQVISGALRGAGNTFDAMVLAIVSLWMLQFPLAYVLSKHTTLAQHGIWWALAISNTISAAIATIWFVRGKWKQTRLVGDAQLREEAIQSEVIQETIVEEGVQ